MSQMTAMIVVGYSQVDCPPRGADMSEDALQQAEQQRREALLRPGPQRVGPFNIDEEDPRYALDQAFQQEYEKGYSDGYEIGFEEGWNSALDQGAGEDE